jgi:hypothetical protein
MNSSTMPDVQLCTLKGLSHDLDLAFDDTGMVSFRTNIETGPFKKKF